MRILIVDDSRAMRMIIARVLRQTGHAGATLAEAADGVEALAAIRADCPDLVLCDWNMPRMTGIELLRTLRAEGDDVRFGFVTVESTGQMRARAIESGALFLIAKPFTAARVEQVLSSLA